MELYTEVEKVLHEIRQNLAQNRNTNRTRGRSYLQALAQLESH